MGERHRARTRRANEWILELVLAFIVLSTGCNVDDQSGSKLDRATAERDESDGYTGMSDAGPQTTQSASGPEGAQTSGENHHPSSDLSVPGSTGQLAPDASASAGTSSDQGAETVDAANVLFAETFEATDENAIPTGFKSFVSYVVDMNNTKASGTYALVDTSKPHAGKKSLHVKSGSAPAMITKALPDGTKALFLRVYVYLTGSLGQAPGRNHETLLGVRKSVGGANDELRFGEIKGVIGVNEVPSDNISPKLEQWGKGPQITAGTWHCLEVAFRGDLDKHEVRAWSDGTEVFAVNEPSQWQNGPLSPTFLDGKFVELIMGWHSFSNYANELWFDDLVVAKERVGCQ